MDKLLAEGASLTPALLIEDEEQYDKLAASLATRLQAIPSSHLASKEVLDVRNQTRPTDASILSRLQSLDATTQTIAYLFITSAAITTAVGYGKAALGQLPRSLLPEGELWPYMTNILLNFDPVQVRYAGTCLTDIVNAIASGAAQSQNYVPAIQLLNSTILRVDPTSSTFTTTHHKYVRLCLQAGAYADALSIIDRQIYHLPGGMDKQAEARSYKYRCSVHESSASFLTPASGLTQKITSRMFLDYNYMCALCYMALGQYSRAISLLEVILVAPTANGTTSYIALEAYKKWVLLNLVVLGSVPEYPRPVYAATARTVRALAKPYDCLAEAFKYRDSARLLAEAKEGQTLWHEDNNTGLVVEVMQAQRKYAVLKMARLFASLPISQVDAHIPTDHDGTPTQVYLQSLISSGELRATMTPASDGSDQILRFLPGGSDTRSEAEIEQRLNDRAQQLQAFVKHVNDAEHRMEISKEYVDMLKKLKKNRDDDNKKGPGPKAPAPFDELDEDMMGDEL